MSELFHSAEFWVAVSFVLFVLLVARKAGAAVAKLLDARAEKIRQQLNEAQQLREEAQAALANYQRLQRDALAEAAEIVESAKAEAGRMREQAEADLAERLKRREDQAMEKIARAEAQALQDVRERAVDLAMAATAHLVRSHMDAPVADRIVADAIAELPRRLQ